MLSNVEWVEKFEEELSSIAINLSSDSGSADSGEDFGSVFRNLYKNNEYFDFEIKTSSDSEPIRVHRIYLSVNGFKNVAKCKGQTLIVDANNDLVRSVIDLYYNIESELKIDENNVELYSKIANQLGNQELLDYLTAKKEELAKVVELENQVFGWYQKLKSIHKFKASFKRKTKFEESVPNKTMKSEVMSTIGLKPREVTNHSMNNSVDILIDPNINGHQNNNQSKDNQSIDESLNAENVDKSLIDENEDNSKSNDPIINITNDSVTNQSVKKESKTIITQVNPSESDETDSETIDENLSKIELNLDDKTGSENESHLSKKIINKKRESTIQTPMAGTHRMDYTKLIKSISEGANRVALVKVQNRTQVQAQIARELRRRSIQQTDTTNETMDNIKNNYQKIIILPQNPKNVSTQVWKSRFVPTKSGEETLVAVVGGPIVNWFNLDKINSDSNEPIYSFNSLKDENLRSIDVCLIHSPIETIIYAFGSMGCVYIVRHPTVKKANDYLVVDNFGVDEEVMDIVFHITSECNLLFCGTSDRLVIFTLKLDETGKPKSCDEKFVYPMNFPITSIIYIEKYDCLVASGEYSDLIVLKGVSSVDQKPNVGKITPKMGIGSISSLIYIREYDIIGFRPVDGNTDYLQLAPMEGMMAKFNNSKNNSKKPIILPFTPGVKLQYRINKIESEYIEFIYMFANETLIACGNCFGEVYIYACNRLLKGKGTVQPIQIIKEEWPNSPPFIRSVSISDDLRYMVTTTNNNLILVYKSSLKD